MRAAAIHPIKTKTPSGAVILSFRKNHLAEKAGNDGLSFDVIQKKLSTVFNQFSADFVGRADICLANLEKIFLSLAEVPQKSRLDVLRLSAEKYLGYIRDNASLFAYPLAERFAIRCLDFILELDTVDNKALNLARSYIGCISLSLVKQGETFKDRPDLMEAYMSINQACAAYLSDIHKKSLN